MTDSNLQKAWLSLAPDENEPEIARKLICPAILPALGFEADEMKLEYMTGWGSKKVDVAARKNTPQNNFSIDKANPSLIVELKKRDRDLSLSSTVYKNAVNQLKGYLSPASEFCRSATWGILSNANRIQLFRRHGKVVYPFTTNIELNSKNIDEKINLIRQYLDNEKKALSVAIYNNKGGVGKTTTVINLAGILSLPLGKKGSPLGFNKKVLVVDFDPNQKDLTDLLQVTPGKLPFSNFLDDYKKQNIQDVISRYVLKAPNGKEYGFDVIPTDDLLHNNEKKYTDIIRKGFLRKVLSTLKNTYDYILIDSPPGSNRFTEEAITAADVILMPSKHNGVASFKNAAVAMKTMFPTLGELRREFDPELGNPVPLPIFFNGESITPAQKEQAQKAILSILKQAKKEDKVDLLRFFFPKYTPAQKNLEIFEMPNYAHIASAAFSNRPAVFTSKRAREYYRNLVREYFI